MKYKNIKHFPVAWKPFPIPSDSIAPPNSKSHKPSTKKKRFFWRFKQLFRRFCLPKSEWRTSKTATQIVTFQLLLSILNVAIFQLARCEMKMEEILYTLLRWDTKALISYWKSEHLRLVGHKKKHSKWRIYSHYYDLIKPINTLKWN